VSGAVTPIPLDPTAARPTVLRSLLYLPRNGGALVGQSAVEAYMRENTGRPVRYARKLVRVIEMTFAETGTIQAPGYALVDENEPGRCFQSLKTFLRDASFRGTSVFGETYSLEDLVAHLLSEIRSRVEAFVGCPVDGWTIGRPVRFATRDADDALAERRLAEACRRAGLRDVRFEYEPVAAGRHYAATAREPRTALVFDFGGGTLDLTVLRIGGAGRPDEVLAVAGVPVAGDVFDSRIVEGCLLEHFGAGATLDASGRPFPVHIPYALTDWASIVGLNEPATLETIRQARRTSNRRPQIAALECLVTRNHGLALYEEVRRTKARVSSRERDWITMNVEDIHFAQEMTRADFESFIGAERRLVEVAVDRVVAAAGLAPREIDVVIRTGGSSSIPLFVEMLERKVGRGKLVEHDHFASVAGGLAIAAESVI
jgi:hypothetical chaperone protein